MADRVYPAAKATTMAPPPSFPATKAQSYNARRPAYRPQPPPKRRRGCCCSICLWITFVLIGIILLCAIASGVFYLLYRPHRPTFNVSSLRLNTFNVTSGKLTSRLDLSVTARNPNRKIVYLYDPAAISVVASDGVSLGDGSFPGFTHGAKNITMLKTTISAAGESLDSSAAADLKGKSSISVDILFETKAGVKVGGLKSSKMRIRVVCSGVSVPVPKGKGKVTASTPDASCKVKLRIKIWKWKWTV